MKIFKKAEISEVDKPNSLGKDHQQLVFENVLNFWLLGQEQSQPFQLRWPLIISTVIEAIVV
jgi:hypothetical protein